MYITDKLVEFLSTSRHLSNSTILLTDLEKVIFTACDGNDKYSNKFLSSHLKQIINLYISDITSVDYINTSMDTVFPIVSDDNILEYKSQIILPIVHNDRIVGLLIFIADDRKYLPSNLTFAKTTKHFVELFSSRDYSTF